MLRFIFALCVGWFSMSCLIDFVAVPIVFRTVSKLYEAANVGIRLFSIFNPIEFIFSLILVSFALFTVKKKSSKLKKFQLAFSFLLLIITASYTFHITPMISTLSEQKRELDVESDAYVKIEQQHNFYHHLYVKMDSVKVILLLIMVGLYSRQLPKGERL